MFVCIRQRVLQKYFLVKLVCMSSVPASELATSGSDNYKVSADI